MICTVRMLFGWFRYSLVFICWNHRSVIFITIYNKIYSEEILLFSLSFHALISTLKFDSFQYHIFHFHIIIFACLFSFRLWFCLGKHCSKSMDQCLEVPLRTAECLLVFWKLLHFWLNLLRNCSVGNWWLFL